MRPNISNMRVMHVHKIVGSHQNIGCYGSADFFKYCYAACSVSFQSKRLYNYTMKLRNHATIVFLLITETVWKIKLNG